MAQAPSNSKTFDLFWKTLQWAVWPLGLGCLLSGWLILGLILLTIGGIGLYWMVSRHLASRSASVDNSELETHVEPVSEPPSTESFDEINPSETLHAAGRYALLAHPQIAEMLHEEEFERIADVVDREMTLVPDGQVVTGEINEALEEGRLDANSIARCRARMVDVDAFYIDRYPVTNEQFLRFVTAGGYDEIPIWDREIWPEIFEYVDRSGEPGPRYWRDGRFLPGEEHLPVVGVSWYEAVAYARWTGKRLPTEAEWVKAGSWPVVPKPGLWIQRRYPWGNTFDHQKANIWGSGPDEVVPVDQFGKGASVGGACQLIGNIWEWTSGGFGQPDDLSLTLPVPMKSIHGGAYDTYFESQATCHFSSGENPMRRKHNIGFRLAIGVCDLSPKLLQQLGLGGTNCEPTISPQEALV